MTYDGVSDRWAVFNAFGDAVPFVSGTYDPAESTPASTTMRSTVPSRRLLQANVWANYSNLEARPRLTYSQGV